MKPINTQNRSWRVNLAKILRNEALIQAGWSSSFGKGSGSICLRDFCGFYRVVRGFLPGCVWVLPDCGRVSPGCAWVLPDCGRVSPGCAQVLPACAWVFAGLCVGVAGLWVGFVRSILSKSLFTDRWECIIFVQNHPSTTNRNSK